MREPTPGPWEVNVKAGRVTVIPSSFKPEIAGSINQINDGCVIASLFGPDAETNAHLLVSASNLLKALQLIAETDFVDAALDPQRAIRIAKEAIQKATGEQP